MSINNTVIYYEDGLLNNYRELNIKDIDIYIYIYYMLICYMYTYICYIELVIFIYLVWHS